MSDDALITTKYHLKWRGEIIEDDIETAHEAHYLRNEYALAFCGVVTIHETCQRSDTERSLRSLDGGMK